MNPSDQSFVKSEVPLLFHFTPDQLIELAKGCTVREIPAGQFILYAGDEVHFLGILLEGAITASVPAEGGRVTLGQIKPGETFGEMALMSGDPAIADLRTDAFSRIMYVPLTLFQSLIMANSGSAQLISMTISSRFQMALKDPQKAAAVKRTQDEAGQLDLKGERPESILVLNCGSSSLKYSFFDTEDPQKTARGHVQSIGTDKTRLVQESGKGRIELDLAQDGGYTGAFKAMLSALADKERGVMSQPSAITVVGHRVVHGGERFNSAVVIDDAVLAQIEALNPLAPLHNPVNVAGIREARRVFPGAPHVAVFDTAFHATLPGHASLYGLPHEYHEKKGVRRYGFHGTSHHYVMLAAAQYLRKRPRELRIVSCHLGSGASICAIDHGRSVDTSMGFTPGEGLIMGTRCGDLDPGIPAFLERTEGLNAAGLDEMLNKRSGLLGLSGISSDMREIEKAADAGDARALMALDAFCYRVRKYIGAYIAAMGGIDVLVFTAGIGQGSAGVRAAAVQGLSCMGVRIDEERNRQVQPSGISTISTGDSPVTVLVVPTDEERMIARESLRALSREYLVRTSDACRTQPIPVEVSAHHIHLTQEHVEALFGAGHQLEKHADLSQPGQYACKEQLTIVGPKGSIERVRVLGPTRKATQVEIAMTEQFKLGIQPPIRESGDIEGSPGCTLEGPSGSVILDKGVICALRHIHMSPADALRYGLRDKSTVRVRVPGDRELVFGDVRIRVDPNFALAMHIDTDEANSANLRNGAQGYIDGIQRES